MNFAKLTLPLLLILAALTGYSAFAASAKHISERDPAQMDVENRISIRSIRLADLSYNHIRFDEFKQLPDERAALLKMYHPELTKSMKENFQGVERSQKVVESPYRFARTWERQEEIDRREEMAKWTAREVVNDRLKNLLKGADQDSAPIKVARAASVFVGGEVGAEKAKKPEAAQERKGLKPMAGQTQNSTAPQAEVAQEEPRIPTKLKYKMNVVKGQGEVNFTNPVVTTDLKLNVRGSTDKGDLSTNDRLRASMNKRINFVKIDTSVAYAVNKRVVGVNLSKQITDEISCNVSSSRYTDNSRSNSGERSNQSANLMYSVSF